MGVLSPDRHGLRRLWGPPLDLRLGYSLLSCTSLPSMPPKYYGNTPIKTSRHWLQVLPEQNTRCEPDPGELIVNEIS